LEEALDLSFDRLLMMMMIYIYIYINTQNRARNVQRNLMRKLLRKRPLGTPFAGLLWDQSWGKRIFRMELNWLRSGSNGQPRYYKR